MKRLRLVLVMAAAMLSLASCSSSEPEWADPEAHEKTEQLRAQYGPLIVGTWHIESIKDTKRFYEQLTFNDDGTLKGVRKWQTRMLVVVDDDERYTDWEDINQENGTFTGDWQLSWNRDAEGLPGENRLWLRANFDEQQDWSSVAAYSLNAIFINADATTLSFGGGWVHNGEDGSTIYTRSEAEPSF